MGEENYGKIIDKGGSNIEKILFPKFTDDDIRYYMYQILIALDYLMAKIDKKN